jgi:hypothetical protein
MIAIAGLSLSACGASAQPFSASKILTYNAFDETAHLDLVAAATNGYSGFNFDGYGGGEMLVRIPVGWTVDATCTNASTALTHSCAIVESDTGSTLPVSGGTVAFAGATVPNAVSGLTYGVTDRFSFVASKVGTYRIDCLVTGHEADGMWDWFVVTSGGKPSVTTSSHPITVHTG